MSNCAHCEKPIEADMEAKYPFNPFCWDCTGLAFMGELHNCAQCGKICTDKYGFGNEFAFCGPEHKEAWEIRRARTLMSPEELAFFNR